MRARILFAAAMALAVFPACAATTVASNPLNIPWGNLLVQLIVAMTPSILLLVAALLAWIYSKLPAGIVTALKAGHADILVNRAVNQAIAMVDGAVKGKTVSVTIANQLIETAAQYLVQEAPWLVDQLGARVGKVIAGKLADLNMLGDDAHAATLDIQPAVVSANPQPVASK